MRTYVVDHNIVVDRERNAQLHRIDERSGCRAGRARELDALEGFGQTGEAQRLAGSGRRYRYLESFVPDSLAVRNVHITCHVF